MYLNLVTNLTGGFGGCGGCGRNGFGGSIVGGSTLLFVYEIIFYVR
jgi:hypothetical protein